MATSASAIVAVPVTGRYVYHIDGYSRTKDLPNGKCIYSPTFKVADCSWRLCYYPNGACSSYAGYVSIFLVLGASVAEPVEAISTFTLLDPAGSPVPGYTVCTELQEYSVDDEGYGFDDFIAREILEASDSLVDDCFKIRCDVSVISFRAEDREPPLSDLQRHLGNLLVTKQGADTTFLVSGETFRAHSCILAARSPVFKSQLSKTTKEGGLCGIRIDDMEPEVFKTLLHFVYTDSLPEMTEQEVTRMVKPLLAVADAYDMEKLKLISAEKLMRNINMSTAAEMLALAVRHRCHLLKEACTVFLQHPPVLEMVVASSDGFADVAGSCPVLLKELWDGWFENDPIQDELRNLTGGSSSSHIMSSD